MKILITGTAGFIGFHLAKRLLERGDTVVGIDNINDYYDVTLKYARLAQNGISREAEQWYTKVQSTKYPNYSFVRMNLEDREQLNQLFEQEKFDKVCNLAAQAGVRYSLENPHAYINSNIVGFINILEACRHHNIKHLAYASSSSVYGNNTKMPLSTGDNVDHPISLYAATKKSNELMAHTYSHLFGLPTTGLRFFTVYGPWGRPDMALFLFTKAILENQPIKVFNNGNMVRDFTYIDDIVEGVVRVIDNPPSREIRGANISPGPAPDLLDARVPEGGTTEGTSSPQHGANTKNADNIASQNPTEKDIHKTSTNKPSALTSSPYAIYNIGNSSPVPLMEYIKAIEDTLGKTAQKEFLPMQPGDVPRTEADVTDLVKILGYKPNTPVQKGIERFIEWYKSYFSTHS
jgi:UDP-glucuronate 4-epimerase